MKKIINLRRSFYHLMKEGAGVAEGGDRGGGGGGEGENQGKGGERRGGYELKRWSHHSSVSLFILFYSFILFVEGIVGRGDGG